MDNIKPILFIVAIEPPQALQDAPPDPNLSDPLGGSLAVMASLAFAAGCGWWRKRQEINHKLRRLRIIATLESLLKKDTDQSS
jgi:hypothetical protein